MTSDERLLQTITVQIERLEALAKTLKARIGDRQQVKTVPHATLQVAEHAK